MTDEPISDDSKLIAYLKERVSQGHNYFKAKRIAKEIDISAKCIGQLLYRFSKEEKVSGLSIKQWGKSSSATTWCIMKVKKIVKRVRS